jgi:hypothetical protein
MFSKRAFRRLSVLVTLALSCTAAEAATLTAPYSLAGSPISGSRIDLSWFDTNASETGFEVERSLSASAGFALIGTPGRNANSYADIAVSSGTTYYYRVRATGRKGQTSPYSNVAGATTPVTSSDTTAPAGSVTINANATYTNATAVTLTLSATDGVGVTGYYVSASATPPSATAVGWTAVTPTPSYNGSLGYPLSSGDGTKTIYAWYKDAASNVSAAASDAIVLDQTLPTNGTLTATAGNAQAALSWAGFADTTSGLASTNPYKLVYSTGAFPASCASGTVLYSGTATSFPHTGLTNGTTYYYRACATDNAGNMSTGATASAVPQGTVALNPELVGFVPAVGAAQDVVVDPVRGLAYVASAEFGLAVVNVSNPAAPVTLGATIPPFTGSHLAVSGSLAFVAGNGWGIVVDLSNPADPAPIGSLAGTMSGVAMAGQYAYALLYVSGNPGHYDLIVVTLQVPSAPAIVGRVTVGAGGGVAVVGSLAYVAAGSAGLQIVDVSNPAAPRIVSTVDTPGSAKGVAVANGYAYVADTTSVQVIDVHSSTSPFISGALPSAANTVAVAGNRLYALNGSQFLVIDVTSPAVPFLLSATDSLGAQALTAAGTLAYLASPSVDRSLNKGGLYILNVSVPTAPAVLAHALGGLNVTGVAAAGSLAAVVGGSGLRVLDVTDAFNPAPLGSLGGTMMGVAMTGQYAYVFLYVSGNPGHYDLAVVTLQVPSAPAIVGQITVGGAGGMTVVGSLVYVAAGSAGLQIVDVSNPAAPRIVSTVDTPGSAKGVAVANGYAYVADNTSVQVIDVHSSTSPFLVGSLATAANAVTVVGNRLYALNGSQFLVIDVTTPAAPALLSATTGYAAQGLAVAGSLAFLATPAPDHSTGGVRVLNVSTPLQPQLLEQIVVPGSTRSVFATATFVYAGDDAATLDVIQISP